MNGKRQDRAPTPTELLEHQLTGQIVGCFRRVYNALDIGLLESVYRNALALELASHGLHTRTEVPIEVRYRGVEVGFFRIDLLVENKVAIEVKSTELLPPVAKRQLLNYLRVSSLDIGLLLHFGPEPKIHRLVSPRVLHQTRGERTMPFP